MVEAKTSMAELPNEQKIFVGGLAPSTTDVQLKEVFAQFGPVIATEIRTTIDQVTQMKRSRGFGFVVFQDASYVEGAAGAGHVFIDGKNVEIKRIDERSSQEGKQELETRKIFVGGLPEDVTSDSLKAYFQTALDPDVKEARVMTHVDGTSRCFGYVTLSSKEMVEKAIQMRENHFINSKWIDVKASVLGGVNNAKNAGGKKGKGKGKGGKQQMGKGGGFGKGGFQQQQWGQPANGYGAMNQFGYGQPAAMMGGYGAQQAAMMGAYQQQAAAMGAYQQQAAAYGQQAAMGAAAGAAPGAAAGYGAQYGMAGAAGGAPGVDMSAYGAAGAGAAAPQAAYGAAYGQQYGQQPARAAPY